MKKITLTLAAIAAAFTMNAQEINRDISLNSSAKNLSFAAKPQGTQAVVLDQPINSDENGSAYGFLSDFIELEGQNIPLLHATSFSISASTDIGTLIVPGFQSNDSLSTYLTGLNVYIFPNESNNLPDLNSQNLEFVMELNQPNNGLFQIEDQTSGRLVIDIQNFNNGTVLSLDPGTYWLCVAPVLTFDNPDDFSGDNLWRWFSGVPADSSLPTAAIFDPAGIITDPANSNFETSSGIIDAGEPGHFAFQMLDEGGELAITNLDKSEFLYYNDNNSLILSAKNAIKSVNIYNILGKQVVSQKLSSNKENIDISHLQAGIYLAQVQVEGNTKTFKFVKK